MGAWANATDDFDEEAKTFLEKDEVNTGKVALDADDFKRINFFAGAGPMETTVRLLTLLEQAGSTLKSPKCRVLQPVFDEAARKRFAWANSKAPNNSPGSEWRPLQYALFSAHVLHASGLFEADQASRKYRDIRGLPKEWDIKAMIDQNGCRMLAKKPLRGTMMGMAPLPGTEAYFLQQLLDETFKEVYTRDRRGGEVPQRLVLVAATYIQNELNWVEYIQKREEIRAEIRAEPLTGTELSRPKTMDSAALKGLNNLDEEVQEAWMWHGTSKAGADGITSEDFRLTFAGNNAGTLYGRGIYLAEACSKSDEYTQESDGERYLLLCRSTLGRINYNDDSRPDVTELEDSCLKGRHHCVLGDREKIRGTYREFIVFDDDQVYPEYIVKYRRQYYKLGGDQN